MHGLRHPVDVPSDGQSDGTAHDDRCGQTRFGASGDRRDALFRLGTPGPQGPSPRADRCQAGGQPARRGRCRPHHDDGPARRSDSGIFRRPRRCALCQRHLRSLHPEPQYRRPVDRCARHGRSQTRQHLCQIPSYADHHFAQGACEGQRRRQDDGHRRRRGA